MPSTAVRVLELKFQVDTTQFDNAVTRILSGIRQVQTAMGTLGAMGISVSRSFNITSNSFNRATTATRNMGGAATHATKGMGALFLQTKGGLRVFGGEHGLLKVFALIRNQLLLMAFGFGPVILGFREVVKASVEFTNAMTGLGAIAKATGENINQTQNAAKELAAKGFMTVTEAAMGLKNLLATGFGLEDAMKIMKGFADSAAFNRQASFEWGESVVRATEGIRLGLCIAEGSMIYDASTNDYKPVEDLFDECMKKDKKLITLGYDTNKNDFISVQASHIAYNGIKPVYKIKTSSGKEVEATENHRFLTKDGYKLLKDLKVDDVLVGMDNHSAINKKPKKEIKCKKCNVYFLPSNGREYLCLDCKTVICRQCGKAFIVKPKYLKTAHFCSKDCLAKWQSENMSGFNSPVTKHGDSFTFISLICKSCGAEYKRTKKWLKTNKSSFCSCECKKEWQKGKTAKKFFTSVIRECETCGKEVTVKNCHKDTFRFCSRKCRAVWQSEVLMQRENNPNWGGGTTKGRRVLEGKKEYRKWKNAVKERDLFICQNCGIEFNLNAHHIFHYKNYPDRVYDVSNGITLCQSCHIEAHQINRTFCKTEETIVSIEYAGEKRTYDLSVPETRNFVVNGLVSHNSNVADACFVYTTPVLTNKGTISIGDIVEKNLDVKVYSYDFKKKKVVKKKIINRFNNGTKEVYRITTESGKSFVATGNHRFYTLDGNKKELLEFSIGEELVLWEHRENSAPINILSGDKIESIEFEGTATTYNITVEEFHNYFVGSGNTFILSSNSGITKNLSQILKEQGKSLQDVSRISSDASVRQALLNGLMKEFALYTGNAELALGTYSGSVSVLNTSLFNLKKEIGDTLIPLLAKLIKGLSSATKEATNWFKVNKDIIALKFHTFDAEIEALKNLIIFLGKATLALVNFIAENKNLVGVLIAIGAFNKLIPLVARFTLFIIDLTKAIQGLIVMSRALGFMSALITIFGKFNAIALVVSLVITALAAIFAIFRDRQVDVTKAALENNAALMKQTRMQQEYIEMRKKATSAELDAVKAKIKSGDSSVYLKDREKALTAQLSDLEKQALKSTLALEKLELAKQRIEYEKTKKEALTSEYVNLPSVSSYGAMYAEQRKMRKLNLLGGLENQLNTEALLGKAQGAKENQWWKWDEIYAEAKKGLDKIGKFGAETYSGLNEASRKHLENTRSLYEKLIVTADAYRWHEITANKDISSETEETNAKRERAFELLQKIKNETREITAKGMGQYESDLAKAVTQMTQWSNTLKDAKFSASEMAEAQRILRDFYNETAAAAAHNAGMRYVKWMEEATEKAKKNIQELREAITKDKIKQRESAFSMLEELSTRAYEGGIENIGINATGINSLLAPIQKVNAELGYTKDQLRQQAIDWVDLAKTAGYSNDVIVRGLMYIADIGRQETQKSIQELSQIFQQVANEVSSQVQIVANAYWTEREEIKRARNAEIEDLRNQLNQGVIDTVEYAVRRNQIMANANINMANATKNAWKQVSQNVLNITGQMFTQIIAQEAAMIAKSNMLKGLGLSLAGGLGIGLLLAGGTYLLSKSFSETPTVDYENISPGGVSASERKRYGSIAQASPVYLNITPTVSIEGNQVWIAAGSVESFETEVSALMKKTMQSAIDNQEIDLTGINPK